MVCLAVGQYKTEVELLRLEVGRLQQCGAAAARFQEENGTNARLQLPLNHSLQHKVHMYPLAVLRIRIHRIHMFLGLLDPDPDPLVRGMDPDPPIIKH